MGHPHGVKYLHPPGRLAGWSDQGRLDPGRRAAGWYLRGEGAYARATQVVGPSVHRVTSCQSVGLLIRLGRLVQWSGL
jgi:hypothetical protein